MILKPGMKHQGEMLYKKEQVGNDQEKAQSEKKIPTPKIEVGKN